MPTYSYLCSHCNNEFELYFNIKDYVSTPECYKCNKKADRQYMKDVATLNASVKKSDNELKTIGDLAKRNSDRMSDDEKQHLYTKHNSYKENKVEDKPLPKGMSRIKKGAKTIWPN